MSNKAKISYTNYSRNKNLKLPDLISPFSLTKPDRLMFFESDGYKFCQINSGEINLWSRKN